MKHKDFMLRSIYQTVVIVLISLGVGSSINFFRSDGAPFIGDWSVESKTTLGTGEKIDISLEDAKQLYQQGKAIIIDARSPEDFRAGHIEGALNLPWLSFDQYFDQIIDKIDDNHTIITYCDGENCPLSVDLAKILIDFGFQDVKVLVNGWSLWVNNNLPINNGKGVTES